MTLSADLTIYHQGSDLDVTDVFCGPRAILKLASSASV